MRIKDKYKSEWTHENLPNPVHFMLHVIIDDELSRDSLRGEMPLLLLCRGERDVCRRF